MFYLPRDDSLPNKLFFELARTIPRMISSRRVFVINPYTGSMVAMAPSVTLKGSVKFSLKKLMAGGELSQSTYTGPGELLLAPPALGDIVPIRLDGQQAWNVGKDAFLACTQGVTKDYKAQGFGKAMFSGEGLFVYKIAGQGVLFVTSLGAIIQKNVGRWQGRSRIG